MAEKCLKCNAEANAKDGVKCSDCATVCHLRCVGVVTRNKKWKCENCSVESASSGSKASDTGAASTSILDAIAAFRKESNERWDSNSAKLDEVQAEIKSVKVDIVSLKGEFLEVKGQCKEACESVEALKCENKKLTEDLAAMRQQVFDIEQHTRKNNLLISGVPVTAKENMYDLLASFARLLGVDWRAEDVSTAHRLQGRRGDVRPPSIVMCFVSRDMKACWLAARRKKGALTARELSRSFPDTPVYLNEHLTPQTRSIFNEARALVRQKKLSSVWTSDCKVMVKLTPDHRPFRVRDLQHLAQLGESAAVQHPADNATS